MNWFDNNPLGKALAGAGGILAVLALLLAWAWSWDVSSGAEPAAAPPMDLPPPTEELVQLGPLSEYRVVNDRPVFNATRQPIVDIETDAPDIEIEDTGPADMPAMRLTGVVITPGSRFATLSPVEGGEPVVAREGEPLDGPLVGWTVASIEARNISIESTEGDSLDLELSVHDEMIAEPPKPEPPPEAVADAGEAASADGEEQPMSRADQIRQRIEQRREELRREAEEERQRNESGDGPSSNSYQRTIQQMLQRKQESDDDNEENDSTDGD